MTEGEVYKKIQDAGWATKFYGIFIFLIGVLLLFQILFGIGYFEIERNWESIITALVLFPVGGATYYYANKLYKKKPTLQVCNRYLFVFTLLFIPFIAGLIGLVGIWYTVSALLAIKEFNKK